LKVCLEVDDMLWLEFRRVVRRRYGSVKGCLSKALQEALKLWVASQMHECKDEKMYKPSLQKPEIQESSLQKSKDEKMHESKMQKPSLQEFKDEKMQKPSLHKPEVQETPRGGFIETVAATLLPWLGTYVDVRDEGECVVVYRRSRIPEKEWVKISSCVKQLGGSFDPSREAWVIPKRQGGGSS